MQGRTIAVKVTGGELVELNITGEGAQRVTVDVALVLDDETRRIVDRGLVGDVLDEAAGDVLRPGRCRRVAPQRRRGASGARRDVSLALAGQLSEVTAMLDRIIAALGARRALRRRRRTRKARQRASCRMPRF